MDCRTDEDWLDHVLQSLRYQGYCLVTGALDDDLLASTREAMYESRERIQRDVGQERLARAGELGVLRLMLAFDDRFFRLLELPHLLEVVDATVSSTAVLHLQNGLMLPPFEADAPDVFQLHFHRDFPRVLNGYLMSVNVFIAVDEFTEANGGTRVVPGTHQCVEAPSEHYMRANAVTVVCPAGSLLVFDSTVMHAAGSNRSGRDRLAINHQFTRSYVKPQIDYVRALGNKIVLAQPPRTQQLLGWHTRVVTSLDEYYVPSEERLYRGGQG